MRICRGHQVIGTWSAGEINKRIANASLFPSDLYYDEVTSDWLPLAGLLASRAAPATVKPVGRACYCGSGLPFQVCHGDGSHY